MDPEAGQCSECPTHASCVGGTSLPIPDKGFWIDRTELKFSDIVIRCPRGETACDSGDERQTRTKDCWSLSNFSACSLGLVCTPGSTGPLCGACDEGWAKSLSQTCESCPSSSRDSWRLLRSYIISAAVAAVGLPFVFALRKTIAKHEPLRVRKAREAICDLGSLFG